MDRYIELFYFILVFKVALEIPHLHHNFFLITCKVSCDTMTLVYYMDNDIVFWVIITGGFVHDFSSYFIDYLQ